MPSTDLDPDLAAVVTDIESLGVPDWAALSVESAWRVEDDLFGGDAAGGAPDAGAGGDRAAVRTVDLSFDGPGSALPVRVYRPPETPAPTLVFLHGGGWCLGTLDSADDIVRGLCRRVGAVVVSVDYRLAPDHPFPAAVDDAAAAVEWVREHAAALGGDGRLGVAGTSAGGTSRRRPRSVSARKGTGTVWRYRRCCIRSRTATSPPTPTARTPTARC